jgi:hypothetical protein
MLYKMSQHQHTRKHLEKMLRRLYNNEEECTIVVPQHKSIYTYYSYGGPRETVQYCASKRFDALNHYMSKNCPDNINKMVETIRRSKTSNYDSDIKEYELLPIQNEKLLLNKRLNIYFEIDVNEEEEENREKNDKLSKNAGLSKNYVYKISKRGRDNFQVLREFLERCVKEYEVEVTNKKEHQILEYISSKNDEDGRCRMEFRKYPFCSNKHLD